MFRINEIMAAINGQDGIIKPSHFEVMITSKVANLGNMRLLPKFCLAASLPGVQLNTQNIKMPSVGTAEKRPIEAAYNDISLQFICDAKGEIFQIFQQWMQNITQHDGSGQKFKDFSYGDFAYPDDVSAVIEITQYDPAGIPVLTYTIGDAYPLSVADIPVAWAEDGDFVKMTVVFTYGYWRTTKMEEGTHSPPASNDPRAAGPQAASNQEAGSAPTPQFIG